MNDVTGSAVAGNPASAPGVAQATPTATTAQPAATPWYGADLDPDTAQWVQAKNIPDARAALTSYRNLEKLLGADKAGRALIPPKDDAAPEEWGAFFGKLGKPESADGYQLSGPDGVTGDFAKQAATWFHESNLTGKQAEVLGQKWNEYHLQQEKAFETQAAADITSLRSELGPQFDQTVELARRAMREAGVADDKAKAIERAIGVAEATKLFAHLGKQYQEAPLKGGEGAQAGGFALSADTAKAKISQLKSDSEFSARLVKGDAAAKDEWNALHKIAFSA